MEGKVDWKFARDAVGGDGDLLFELVEIFFEEYPKLMAGIQSSIESKTYLELRRFSHTLKGSLRYFGKTEAGVLSGRLEDMGRECQIEGAMQLVGELQSEMNALLPELSAFVASQSPKTNP
ncbi:MAG TPA: Hpt domain-containing protein [Pirellulaceae bacterium]|nr:Hpt domain-containing protein [Pirellulaceae bacterium]